MLRKYAIFIILILLLSGCAKTYYYTAEIEALNSSGEQKQFVLWWEKTEGRFIYDRGPERAAILTECSSKNLAFENISGLGIIYRKKPTDRGVTRDVNNYEACGKITSAERLEDLSTGVVYVEIYCRPSRGDYLKAKDGFYVFEVQRYKEKETMSAPGRPDCRTQ